MVLSCRLSVKSFFIRVFLNLHMNIETILKNFGLSEKEVSVYLSLIELGPSSVRVIGEKAKVNRGTTYDILKSLIFLGIVSYYNRQAKQYFVAEEPSKLVTAVEKKQQDLQKIRNDIQENLPGIQALFEKRGGKPAIKLYEGMRGIRYILEDVLESVAALDEKEYYVYSSSNVRKNVYQAMPEFTNKRISKKIKVKTIALGGGGQLVGLDERKWMDGSENNLKATYEIIYAGKVAHISLDNAENPVGVIIQNHDIYETQKMIFAFSWDKI